VPGWTARERYRYLVVRVIFAESRRGAPELAARAKRADFGARERDMLWDLLRGCDLSGLRRNQRMR